LADKYKKGGMGYGEAKQMLFDKIMETFKPFQKKRKHLEDNPKEVEAILAKGAEKVREVSIKTMNKVRKATGLHY